MIKAIEQAARLEYAGGLDLAGAESLTREELLQRAAKCMGQTTSVVGLPITLGYALAATLQTFLPNPPLTAAMLGVLDHDDAIDPAPALQALQMPALSSIDTTLARLHATSANAGLKKED